MKKYIMLALFLGIMNVVIPCVAEESPVGITLAGTHKLMPLSEFGEVIKFIGKDVITTNTYCVVNNGIVNFVWVGNNKEIIIGSLPSSRIKIEYGNVSYPNIKFKWLPRFNTQPYNVYDAMEQVLYAVITLHKDMKLELE